MKIRDILLVCAAVIVSACDKAETAEPLNDRVMHFEMQHPATRATTTTFEQNDKIGLYITEYNEDTPTPLQISGNWANNVAATLDATHWVTAKKIFWSDNKMDVYGYYPYMATTSINENPFSVALDQSTICNGDALSGYEASDFLWAKATGVVQSGTTVALQFQHRLSKLVLKLEKGSSYEGDLPDNAEVYIHSVVPTATIDFTTGAVTKDLFGEMATIKTFKIDNGTYEAIIVPQRLDSRRPFIEIIVNGVSYLLEDTFNFKAGKQHTLLLTINSNPDQVAIDIGGSVDGDWK